ncbi:acyl transferase domain protein [Mycobacterium kansasii 824]|nr:acyl transferase domain protein [Mycobacterium kansasii 824]
MDPLQPQMRCELADLTPRQPTIPIISTTYPDLGAGPVSGPVFDAEHWATNMRNPVHFQQAIARAGTDHHMFIEISAHPLLTHSISDTLNSAPDSADHRADYLIVGTLQRDTHDTLTFHTNLNTTHTNRPPQTPIRPNRTPRCPPPPGSTPATGWTPHRLPGPHITWATSIRCSASVSPTPPTASGSGKASSTRTCCGSGITSSTIWSCCPVRPTPRSRWRPLPTHSEPSPTNPG